MFDTHCHLNFKAFSTTGRSPFGRDDRVEEVINNAKKVGVNYFVVPGTDIDTSKKAVEIAKKYDGVYAAVGIHPHHIYLYQTSNFKYQKDRFNIKNKTMSHPGFISPRLTRFQDRLSKKQMLNQVQHDILRIEKLLTNPRVVAVGEVGVDRHYYNKTKYADYRIDESFIGLQKEFLRRQIELAIKYDKSLILHNREAKKDLLDILLEVWSEKLEGKTVFHCCEPDFVETGHAPSLLHFAKKHNIYIGVDGDVTYWREKQEFIKKVPLEMLVLETDSPFLLPEPLRSQRKFLPAGRQVTNEPKNLDLIASSLAGEMKLPLDKLIKITKENSLKLFNLY